MLPEAPVGHRQQRTDQVPSEQNLTGDPNDPINRENAALDRMVKGVAVVAKYSPFAPGALAGLGERSNSRALPSEGIGTGFGTGPKYRPAGQQVLQTSRECPEIAGRKRGVFARRRQQNQMDSRKSDRLPLHHSPLLFSNFKRLVALLAVLVPDRSTPSQAWRRSTCYLPPLASAGEKASCRG